MDQKPFFDVTKCFQGFHWLIPISRSVMQARRALRNGRSISDGEKCGFEADQILFGSRLVSELTCRSTGLAFWIRARSTTNTLSDKPHKRKSCVYCVQTVKRSSNMKCCEDCHLLLAWSRQDLGRSAKNWTNKVVDTEQSLCAPVRLKGSIDGCTYT